MFPISRVAECDNIIHMLHAELVHASNRWIWSCYLTDEYGLLIQSLFLETWCSLVEFFLPNHAVVCGRYILIYPQGCDVCNHLSLFLCVANHDKLLPGLILGFFRLHWWSIFLVATFDPIVLDFFISPSFFGIIQDGVILHNLQ